MVSPGGAETEAVTGSTGGQSCGAPSGRTPDERRTTRPEGYEGFYIIDVKNIYSILCRLRLARLVIAMLVLAPLIHVPQHVEQPQIVRSAGSHTARRAPCCLPDTEHTHRADRAERP